MSKTNPNKRRYKNFDNQNRRYIEVKNSKNKEGLVAFEENNESLIHGTYGALLIHPKWKNKRLEILERDGQKCVVCQSKENLQVHHRQYHFIHSTNEFKLPWDYANNFMVTLCETCNQRGHSKFKVPIIKI